MNVKCIYTGKDVTAIKTLGCARDQSDIIVSKCNLTVCSFKAVVSRIFWKMAGVGAGFHSSQVEATPESNKTPK